MNKRNTEAETKATQARQKGNKPFEAASFTQEEIEMLYSSSAFGGNSPQGLINPYNPYGSTNFSKFHLVTTYMTLSPTEKLYSESVDPFHEPYGPHDS